MCALYMYTIIYVPSSSSPLIQGTKSSEEKVVKAQDVECLLEQNRRMRSELEVKEANVRSSRQVTQYFANRLSMGKSMWARLIRLGCLEQRQVLLVTSVPAAYHLYTCAGQPTCNVLYVLYNHWQLYTCMS